MWTSNNALVPDPDKEDILASGPTDWPFLRLGLRMCGWGDGQIKYYLLGTPVIWYFSTISLGLGLMIAFWYFARMQRHYNDWLPGESRSYPEFKHGWPLTRDLGQFEQFLHVGKVALAGWSFHYRTFSVSLFTVCRADHTVPFLIMGRVTYLHHYVSI